MVGAGVHALSGHSSPDRTGTTKASLAWPSVSVVIPVYNRTRFLPAAIQSVLDQEYAGEMTVVVVDDGSERPVRASLGDAFPSVRWVQQRNQGLGAARQSGSEATQSTLVAYQDDDDLWLPGKLRRQVNFLNAHPDVGVVFSDVCHFVGDEERSPGWFQRFESLHEAPRQWTSETGREWIVARRSLLDLALLDSPPFAQSILVRRSFLQRIGGWRRDARRGSEFEFATRATLAGGIGYIDRVLVELRRGHAQVTRNLDPARIDECRNLFRWAAALRGSDARDVAPRLVRRFCRVAQGLRKNGRTREAVRVLAWAGRLVLRSPRISRLRRSSDAGRVTNSGSARGG